MKTLLSGKRHELILDWSDWAFGANIELNKFILGMTINFGPLYFEFNLLGVL